jgi:NADPH:quinone reductase-like Zn-dependent oxidoreductase
MRKTPDKTHHFANGFYAVKPGDLALVNAATGGVGLMLTQMIKLLGGRVIARVSTEGNAQIARGGSRSRHRRKRRQFREGGSAAY